MRSRSFVDPPVTGFFRETTAGGATLTETAITRVLRHVICNDLNPGPGNFDLSITQHPLINHQWESDGRFFRYDQAPMSMSISHYPVQYVIPDLVWDVNYLATLCAARTNPSRPEVSIPQVIGELRELPKAIYKRGSEGLSWAKTDTVGIRFGILPMISDVMKLMRFSESVTRRSKEFDRLQSGRGLKRRVKLGIGTRSQGPFEPNCEPLSGPDAFEMHKETRWEVWGTVRWKPGIVPMTAPSGSPERINEVRRILLGVSKRNDIYSYARDAWEILPWSWMADWFGNCGDYLDANRNQDVAQAEEIWIMRKGRTRLITSNGSVKYVNQLVSKERFAGNISLTVNPRPLSPGQVSILGGLALNNVRHKMPKRLRS